jgi:predicted site-specific integrase-resolvase
MPKTMGNLTLYDIEDLSEILGIQDRTLRQYLIDGKLKGRKLVRKLYVSEESLMEYFQESDGQQGRELR